MHSAPFAVRLAARNLRHRPAQAALVLLTLSLATCVFGVGTALQGSADGPWKRVWNATNGFHIDATYYRNGDPAGTDANLPTVRRTFAALAAAPSVRAVGGPWPLLSGRLEVGTRGGYEGLSAEVREPGRSAVDQPLLTAGSWLASASPGIVLEQGLAGALHVRPGDRIRINGHPFPVRGAAMTVSQSPFPLDLPALIWVTPRTGELMRRIGLNAEGLEMQLRLDNPDDAAAFVAAHRGAEAHRHMTLFLDTWQQRLAESHADLDVLAGTLLVAGVVVGLLAVATAAVIVAGRMAAQTRQIGTLKAVGVTPRQIVTALLVEHLTLAALATLLGLGAGWLIAPRLAATSPAVLGPAQSPVLSWHQIGTVAGVAAIVVVLSTVRPAMRGLRHSALRSLTTQARPPRRTTRLARLAAAVGMPLIAVLGLRSAWRRPSRLLTNAAGLALAIALIVVAAGLWSSRSTSTSSGPGSALSSATVDTLYHQVRVIVLTTGALLVVLGTINAVIVASFAARDGARSHAMLRAVGVTPRQTVISLVVSQLGTCVLAVLVGIPLGLGAWRLIDNGDLSPVSVPVIDLVLVVVALAVIFTAAVSLPAWRLAQRPVATALAYE